MQTEGRKLREANVGTHCGLARTPWGSAFSPLPFGGEGPGGEGVEPTLWFSDVSSGAGLENDGIRATTS